MRGRLWCEGRVHGDAGAVDALGDAQPVRLFLILMLVLCAGALRPSTGDATDVRIERRNAFIGNYFENTVAFVDAYWKIIHRAAGWDAMRYWLFVCAFSTFLAFTY